MAKKKPTTPAERFQELLKGLELEPSTLDLPSYANRRLETAGRMQYQETFYYIYKGVFDSAIEQQLRYRYKTLLPDYINFVAPTLNPFKLVARRKAQVYIKPPFRVPVVRREPPQPKTPQEVASLQLSPALVSTDEVAERLVFDLMERCPGLNLALLECNRLQHATRNPIIWPYIYDANGRRLTSQGKPVPAASRDYKIKVRVLPPHICQAVPSKDYKMDMLAYWDDREAYSFSYWDPNTQSRDQWWMEKDGAKWKAKRAADLAEPIMVKCQDYNGADIWEYPDGMAMARATLNATESETFENRVNFLRSFKQAVVDRQGYNELAEQMRAGPGKFWISDDGDLQFYDLTDKDVQYLESIEKRISMALANEGISPLLYFGNPKTPEELGLISQEKVSLFHQDLEVWRPVEQQLWASIFEMARTFGLLPPESKSWRMLVQFREPLTLGDPMQRYELWEKKEKLGLVNVMDLIRDEHFHIQSELQAMGAFTKNKNLHAARVNYSRALQTPESKDPQATVEKIKGTITGAEGSGGPLTVTNKEATGQTMETKDD